MSKLLFAALTLATLGLGTAFSQHAPGSPDASALRTAKRVQLGRFLFRTPKLSLDDTVSCASCHDLRHALADEKAESLGVLGSPVGRNSPTLVGIRHVSYFPGARAGSSGRTLRASALTLAERCLAPIENPLEMGSSIEVAVKKLRALPGMDDRFDEAFGASTRPVTGRRIGAALAAFLETLEIPETRFHAFLRGDEDALDRMERRGYRRFVEAGCAECHRGRNLSDGLMHPVLPPEGERARAQRERARTVVRAAVRGKQHKGLEFPRRGLARPQFQAHLDSLAEDRGMCGEPARRSRGGYGGTTPGATIEVQTLPLWNVTATAPYFRDGSEPTLRGALRRHVAELREIQKTWPAVKRTLGDLEAAGLRPAARLVAKRRDWVRSGHELGELDELDLLAIERFLGVLTTDRGRDNDKQR